jgi:hypothetical protein
MERIYINNSEFMEFVDDLASDYVQLKYGKSACIEIKDGLSKNTCIVFTEKAQDYYSEIYYKIEKNINNLLNIYSEVDKQN